MISRQASVLATLLSLPLLVELGCDSESMDVANPAVTGVGAGVTSSQGGSGAGDTGGTSASGGSSSGGTSAAGGAAAGGAGGNIPPPPTTTVPCLNQIYECGDLQDNDNDGLIDYQDPDCLGPCDNTEDSYYPDLPGASGQNCDLDCFWDQGQGHDWNCYWDHQCDPLSLTSNAVVNPQPECAYDGTAQDQLQESFPPSPDTCQESFSLNPGQDQECLDKCLPLAPNGCDCFGCCEIAGQTVWLGSVGDDDDGSCTLASVGTPSFLEDCHPCTQVPSCLNDCGECELCLGKTELPPECFPPGTGGGGQGGAGGAPQDCPVGQDPCGLSGQDPCGTAEYCITGCCVPIPQ